VFEKAASSPVTDLVNDEAAAAEVGSFEMLQVIKYR
jgi:hypothetical protein